MLLHTAWTLPSSPLIWLGVSGHRYQISSAAGMAPRCHQLGRAVPVARTCHSCVIANANATTTGMISTGTEAASDL